MVRMDESLAIEAIFQVPRTVPSDAMTRTELPARYGPSQGASTTAVPAVGELVTVAMPKAGRSVTTYDGRLLLRLPLLMVRSPYCAAELLTNSVPAAAWPLAMPPMAVAL